MLWLLVACRSSVPVDVPPEPSVPEVPTAPAPVPEPDAFCRSVPVPGRAVCWHDHGGPYGQAACAGDRQCCGGTWGAAGTCGACACDEPSGRDGCVPDGEEVCSAPFDGRAAPLSDARRTAMTGVTWKPGCPVGLDALAEIDAPVWGFDGQPHRGTLIVRADQAPVFLDVLEHAWRVRFPFERMEPAHTWGGDDDAIMADNGTSAFNCRAITGGSSYSEHSHGHAIDINPRQNPYVKGDRVLPPEGRAFLERDPAIPGLVADPGPITGAFRRNGYRWGGDWTSRKDYQHFSESGR